MARRKDSPDKIKRRIVTLGWLLVFLGTFLPGAYYESVYLLVCSAFPAYFVFYIGIREW